MRNAVGLQQQIKGHLLNQADYFLRRIATYLGKVSFYTLSTSFIGLYQFWICSYLGYKLITHTQAHAHAHTCAPS